MIQAKLEHKIRYWQDAGCTFFRFDCAPQGLILKKIFHENIFLGAVERSTWISKQAGETYTETQDCLILRDAGQVFSVQTASVDQRGGIVRGLLATNDDLNRLCREHIGQKLPSIDFRDPILKKKKLRNAFVKAHRSIEKNDDELAASSFMAIFISAFAEHMGKLPAAPKPKQKCLSRDIIDYIRANYEKNIALKDFVKVTASNPFVLTRQFRKEIGCTPHDYLHMYRISRAKQYIAEGLGLSETAGLCGFADQSHLTRCFKRLVGVTPGQFLPLKA